jgi:hypothetical protein
MVSITPRPLSIPVRTPVPIRTRWASEPSSTFGEENFLSLFRV